jgi:hypothetical protein
MYVNLIKYPKDEDWLLTRNLALSTRRESTEKIPSGKLKSKFLASEHSPIRSLEFVWEWVDLPYWTSVHFVRHSIGITHFVSSQRNDVQKQYDRRKAPQDSPVNHTCFANAQSIINVSQARLCFTASTETREAWKLFLRSIENSNPELYKLCVPHCIYRNGICPELFSECRYNKSQAFQKELEEYILNFTKE